MDFDPRRVEQFQAITFSHILGIDEYTFNKDLYLMFNPDQIILKSISTADGSTAGDILSVLESTIVEPQIMCSFSAAFRDIIFDIPFKNTKMINGTHSFTLRNCVGLPITHNRAIPISITFIFIKYKI